MDLCTQFKSFIPDFQEEEDEELEEDALHRLLEARGETQTVKAVRETLVEIDLGITLISLILFICRPQSQDLLP